MTDKEVLLDLYGTRNLNELAEKFLAAIKQKDAKPEAVIIEFMPALWLGQSFGSVSVRYSAFRKVLKKSRNRNAQKAFKLLNFPAKGYDILNTKKDEKALENKGTIVFESKEVNNLLNKLRNMVITGNYPAGSSRQSSEQIEAYHLAPYIALATGRRFTEVLKTMEIEKHGTKVTIHGLLKKTDEEDTLSNACLLEEYKTIKKALARLRKIWSTEDLTVDEVGKKFSFTFNRYLKSKILMDEKKTFHDLRALYARECWERYGEGSEMDETDFTGFVLGQKKIVVATDHYLKFKKDTK